MILLLGMEKRRTLMTEITLVITFYGNITYLVNGKQATYEIGRGNCQKYCTEG